MTNTILWDIANNKMLMHEWVPIHPHIYAEVSNSVSWGNLSMTASVALSRPLTLGLGKTVRTPSIGKDSQVPRTDHLTVQVNGWEVMISSGQKFGVHDAYKADAFHAWPSGFAWRICWKVKGSGSMNETSLAGMKKGTCLIWLGSENGLGWQKSADDHLRTCSLLWDFCVTCLQFWSTIARWTSTQIWHYVKVGQNLLLSILVGWTSIYHLFRGALGTIAMASHAGYTKSFLTFLTRKLFRESSSCKGGHHIQPPPSTYKIGGSHLVGWRKNIHLLT